MLNVATILVLAPLFPLLSFGFLGAALLLRRPPPEAITARLVSIAFTLSLLAALYIDFYFVAHGTHALVVELGQWFVTDGYAFELSLLVDPLSATLMTLTAALSGLIARFSSTYLVGEPGHGRFYLLLSLFGSGMFILVMAGSLDLLIAGWEWLGLSSMLLIGFFHTRTFPVRNSLRAFAVYRCCDIGLLFGTVLMHHYAHTSSFLQAFGEAPWPAGSDLSFGPGATLIALCMLWAASGKSALFPVGSWLPRAMEGPTPSSAIFYGALSVHAGVYLALRMSPLLHHAPWARAAFVAIGVLTAVQGSISERVQTDIKSQLAYATITQIGVIFVEIGLNFPRLALFHLVAHALLRTGQLLRSPGAVQELRAIRAASGAPRATRAIAMPSSFKRSVYHLALERFHLDALWERGLGGLFLCVAEHVARSEERWVSFLSREPAPLLPLEHTAVAHVSSDTESHVP